MKNIQILPPEVANQIAAGEVVERPASIVKELIENALDAQAQNIEIYIENGGKTNLEIIDDGHGMSSQDIEKSIIRHATSKLSNINDLFTINSFGFRGEALAAIASVSNLTIVSKPKHEDIGVKLTIQAGKNKKTQPTAANTGTHITIQDLFFSTPARLKYLKNDTTEFQHCYRQIQSFALAHPQVRFSVYKNKKLYKEFLPAPANIRAQQILNISSQNLLPVEYTENQMRVSGFVVIPGECKTNKKHQFLFVNNRFVEDYKIAYATRESYVQSAGIEKHLHPVFVLNITLDPILVDVNVHPRKTEIKFSDPHHVFSLVKKSVSVALHTMVQQQFTSVSNTNIQTPYVPIASVNQNRSAPSRNTPLINRTSFETRNTQRNQPTAQNWQNFTLPSFEPPTQSNDINSLTKLKLIGQVANKYIVAESNHGLYFFDQHALHERQRFEQFWNEFKTQQANKSFASQKLIMPLNITLPLESVSLLFETKNKQTLTNTGFDIQLVSDKEIAVLAVPQILEGENFEGVLQDFADYFADGNIGEHALEQFMRKKLEYKSCRGAVMFGDALETIEMQKLLDDFITTKWRNLCPHGRPNHWLVPFDELDKKFHR